MLLFACALLWTANLKRDQPERSNGRCRRGVGTSRRWGLPVGRRGICEGSVDLLDVFPFVNLIVTSTYQCEGDINEDGSVDLLDVNPFLEILTGG